MDARLTTAICLTAGTILIALGVQAQQPDERTEAQRRIDALGDRVHAVTDKVGETIEKLERLQGTLVSDAIGATAAVVIEHRPDFSAAYRVTDATYLLDGTPLPAPSQAGAPAAVFSGPLQPGRHHLVVKLSLQGQGLPYLEGYRIRLSSSFVFEAEAGKLLTLGVVGFDRDHLTRRFEQRPTVRYDLRVERLTRARAAGLAAPEK